MDYFPFLKAKMNEVSGLRDLSDEASEMITPFFDIPRPKNDNETQKSIEVSIKHIAKYFPEEKLFYLDVFDLNPLIKIDGVHIYEWTLSKFSSSSLIPVIGLDRDPDHSRAVLNYLKNNPENNSKSICIRLLKSDFEDFELIEDELQDLIAIFSEYIAHYDIAFDCRVIKSGDVADLSLEIKDFLGEVYENLNPRRCFVASSSISPIASEYVRPSTQVNLARCERLLWDSLKSALSSSSWKKKLFYGDYGVISPNYSDPNLSPGLFNTVSTPKALYTYDYGYFAVRGGSFAKHGRFQYHDLASIIVAQPFFRGAVASKGDDYIAQSSLRLTKKGSAGTWIKNTLISHIEFVKDDVNSGALIL
jgi:hypothetical protein